MRWSLVFIILLCGTGCSPAGAPVKNEGTLVDEEHEHFHVHSEQVAHEHDHARSKAGGHRHGHEHVGNAGTEVAE